MNSSPKSSFRWPLWLGAAFITIVVLWFAQQIIVRPIIETVASQIVGARVTIGSFYLNILTHRVHITNIQVYNEDGFPPKVFFKASEILVDIDPVAAMQGKIHFPLVVFRLDKFVVFKDPQGKLNVDELKIVKEKLREKNKGPAPNFKIDVLKLDIEQVVVEDGTQTPPLVKAYDLNLKNKTITNINSASKLVGVLMVEVLKPTALQSVGLYAATSLLGVAFLPALAISVAIANDKEVADLPNSADQVFQKSLELAQRLGQVKNSDASIGQISATVYGCDVSIEIYKQGWNQSEIIIKARKYFLARPEIAAGLLYQLKEHL